MAVHNYSREIMVLGAIIWTIAVPAICLTITKVVSKMKFGRKENANEV